MAAPPRLLIYQSLTASSDFDPNLYLVSGLARELDIEGRVQPVAWSSTDPIFLDVLNRERISNYAAPDVETRERVRKALGAQFVLEVEAVKQEDQSLVAATLKRDGRVVWQLVPSNDRNNPTPRVLVNGVEDREATRELRGGLPGNLNQDQGFYVVRVNGFPDWAATTESIVRTMTAVLGNGPLKDFPRRIRIESSLDPAFIEPRWSLTPGANGAWNETVLDRSAEGDFATVITILRDAVDEAPDDIQRRIRLVSVLAQAGLPEAAAREAERAAIWMGRESDLWGLASQMWLAAGNVAMSRNALDQALMRGYTGIAAQRMRGDIALLSGDPDEAIEFYGAVEGDELAWSRALAMTADGRDPALIVAAMQGLRLTDAMLLERYTFASRCVERTTIGLTDDISIALPIIRSGPNPEMLTRLHRARRRAAALLAFLQGVAPPRFHRESHQRRLVAYKLLEEASQEAVEYATSRDYARFEAAESRFTEGLLELQIARETFAIERRNRTDLGSE
ncbi:MAG: hypothetical protein KF812_04685 [Fimbriimonadaceae bacterium]|nr:hypothetical protein [Fimbriimonadaceae bacterium]